MVLSVYALIGGVLILFSGEFEIALAFFAVYFVFAIVNFLKESSYRKRWERMFSSSVEENVKEIAVCYITQRAKKLSKKEIKKFIADINDGNYTLSKSVITAIHSEYDEESDGGCIHYLEYDNDGLLRYVYSITGYTVGDIVWHIKTHHCSTEVIQTTKGYQNLVRRGWVKRKQT